MSPANVRRPRPAFRNQPREFPALTPPVELLIAPVSPCPSAPHGEPGLLTIGDRLYSLTYHTIRGEVEGSLIVGYAMTSDGGKHYDLTADLTLCDCGDAKRRVRKGGCKHAVALRTLRDRGAIS